MTAVILHDPGEVPVLDWLDKTLIDVDPSYQRSLDEGRVDKILGAFSWGSFGALVVAPNEAGRYHCIDGQHRLEAAKRHPNVNVVPAVVITGRGTNAEAESFVNVNGERKNVSKLEMHWAELAAGNEEALTVQQVCQRAGVKVLRYPGSNAKYNSAETIAVSSLRSLVDKRGAFKARRILDVLAQADLAPITGMHIKAAELLMTDPEFADAVEPEALTESLRSFQAVIENEAEAFALAHRTPKAKALAVVWFRKSKKKRKAAA